MSWRRFIALISNLSSESSTWQRHMREHGESRGPLIEDPDAQERMLSRTGW